MTDPTRTDPVVVSLGMDGHVTRNKNEIQIPRAEWDVMSPVQQRQYLEDRALSYVLDYVTPCWKVLSDEGDEWRSEWDDEADDEYEYGD